MLFVAWGQQLNIGEKPAVILYIYINCHAGTPKKNISLDRATELHVELCSLIEAPTNLTL